MPNEFETDPFGGPAAGDITFEIPDGEASVSEFAPPSGSWPSTVLDIVSEKMDKKNPKTGELFDQWVLSFSIQAEGNTYKLRKYLYLTPAAMWNVTDTFRALGVPKGNKKKSDIIGRQCMCVVHRGPSDYHSGEIRSKITKCEPLEVTGPGALSTDPSDDLAF